MEMESSRRPSFDRSRELGLKRPRIAEEPSINNRPFQQKQQRPANAGGVISAPSSRFRVNNDRERDSDESVRGPYQQSNQLQQHQELISQYKAALAELTFNSKPIITNLTIIAGENTHAAKGIAATICANIVEELLKGFHLVRVTITLAVYLDTLHDTLGGLRDFFPLHPTGYIKVPSDQKLPSLYLLDSIVKNIGRDYIKYFAARLPEVFCKAYRQVDGSTHSSMQHLFGTWKGVFPAQSLQIIERELGFLAAANGSSSSTTSRADAQTQRQPHSIHVNPKYLEARRLQQTSRSVQHPQREELLDSGREKSLGAESEDHEYGPGLSRHITSRLGKPGERITDHSFDKQWSSTGRGVEESISSQRNGINARQATPSNIPSRSANVHFPSSQNISSRSSRELPRNWKNSEEEEYMWDDLNPGVADHVAVDNLQKDHWTVDGPDKLEFGGRNTNRLHQADIGSRIDRDTDYLSSDQVPFGRQRSSSWQLQEPLVQGSDIPLPRSGLPHLGSTHAGTSSFDLPTVAASGPTGSLGKRLPSSGKPLISQHSSRDPRLNIAEKEQAQGNSLSQPNRKPAPLSRSSDMHQNLHLDNIKKSEPQSLQKITASSVSTFRSKQYNPSVQQVPLGQSEAEPPVGQLNTSALLAAVMKSGIPPGLLTESAQPSLSIGPSQSSKFKSSSGSPLDLLSLLSKRKTEEPPPSSGPPPSSSSLTSTVTSDGSSSSSNPFSSLINTLMAKGFISASKSESETPASPPLSSKNLDQSPITTSTKVPTVSVPSAIPSSIADNKLTLSQKIADKTTSSKPSHVSPQTVKTEIESLIGFEFRLDVLRQFHSSVVDGLFEDLPHSCSICGLRLKLKERLDRHLEWHALKQSEPEKSSRKWFANSEDWVAGKTALDIGSDIVKASEEDHEPMVPADESHCVCLLCGELFEDFYSLERDEWMFKGAVYMTISSESGSRASSSQTTGHDIIVHEKCMADDSVHDLEQANIAKMEIDA